ncbi:MAG: hypothetical protein HY763_07320 [Planctomycetes bacterium]|nr:hypothetical protein [Planctomycetota bacterium]
MTARRGWATLAADGAVTLLLAAGRWLTLLSAFGLTAYILVRPFLDSPQADGGGVASVFGACRLWPALLANTITVAGSASLLSLVVGVPIAVLCFRTDLPGRRRLSAALLLPACVPLYAVAAAILALVGVRRFEGSALAAGLLHGWAGLPLAVLQLGLAYRSVDRRFEEAAVLDTPWWRVALRFDPPLLLAGAVSVVAVQCWFVAHSIEVTDLLAVRTITEEVYIGYQLSPSRFRETLVVLPYVLAFLALVWLLVRSARWAGVRPAVPADTARPRIPLGGWGIPLALLIAMALAALVLVPTVPLAARIPSWARFADIVHGLRDEVLASSVLATAVAAFVVLTTLGTLEQAAKGGPAARWLRLALVLLLALPAPCTAIALIELLNREGILGVVFDSGTPLVVGHMLRYLPIAVLIALPGWLAIPTTVRDLVRIDGVGAGALRTRVYWPLAAPYLGMAAVAALMLALGGVTTSVLLAPPGVMPLSVRFFTLAHYGLQADAATVCVLTMLLTVIPWAILVRLIHRA